MTAHANNPHATSNNDPNGDTFGELLSAPMALFDIDALKSQGRYYQAGALAAALGQNSAYGFHFGTPSTNERARAEYRTGWCDASEDIENNA